MRSNVLKIYMVLLLLFVTMGNKSFSVPNDVRFIATELLGRPTDRSVTVNVVSDVAVEIFFEYGAEASIYTNQTTQT